ncbi:MAG: DNA polymerase ligase N-terminal domain-containing protein [Planctomycetota bacterium]|nr:DNA polymerase ligase N-terminal domain-containing protein [Planctomycetota bacterium]
MPRFVVLEHTGTPDYKPGVHWDFMLEDADSLRTWELAAPLTSDTPIAAIELPAHRLAYLEYEGPISQNRGNVRRFDCGEYELLSASEAEITLRLMGTQCRGIARLTRYADSTNWTFVLSAE